jgi:biotin carboxylase
MADAGWILTLGSRRQSLEFAAAAATDAPWVVRHVTEEAAEWTPKSKAEVLAEATAVLAAERAPPRAVLCLGRATVPGGIELVAECAAELKESLHLGETSVIGPSPRMATVFGDKWLIHEHLLRLGCPLPRTRQVAVDTVAVAAAEMRRGEFPSPAIVKVVDLTGGAGMEFVPSESALAGAVDRVSALGRPMILTEFVRGDEISFDALRLGGETVVFPAGLKRQTDESLTHADQKIKVNGCVARLPQLEEQVVAILDAFELEGFFSLEGVVVETEPVEWRILEGATRVTNNWQMQNASLGFDCFVAVSRYLRGEDWLPMQPEQFSLALSIPIWEHREEESLARLNAEPWVLQAKIEDLSQLPLSRDSRRRLTVKLLADRDVEDRMEVIEHATGDATVATRVFAEIDRLGARYQLAVRQKVHS